MEALRVRCPKCWAAPGTKCISLRWARSRGRQPAVSYSRDGDYQGRDNPDDHRIEQPHKERIDKSIISPGARPRDVMDVADLATHLEVSKSLIYKWIRSRTVEVCVAQRSRAYLIYLDSLPARYNTRKRSDL